MPELREIFELWWALQTQWRHGFAGPTGLDYTAATATADLMGVELTPWLWTGVRILEYETLAEAAKRNE